MQVEHFQRSDRVQMAMYCAPSAWIVRGEVLGHDKGFIEVRWDDGKTALAVPEDLHPDPIPEFKAHERVLCYRQDGTPHFGYVQRRAAEHALGRYYEVLLDGWGEWLTVSYKDMERTVSQEVVDAWRAKHTGEPSAGPDGRGGRHPGALGFGSEQ